MVCTIFLQKNPLVVIYSLCAKFMSSPNLARAQHNFNSWLNSDKFLIRTSQQVVGITSSLVHFHTFCMSSHTNANVQKSTTKPNMKWRNNFYYLYINKIKSILAINHGNKNIMYSFFKRCAYLFSFIPYSNRRKRVTWAFFIYSLVTIPLNVTYLG